MVNTVQYPHILQIQEANRKWKSVSICCDNPNSKGSREQLADGTIFQYSSIIYVPKNPESILIMNGQDLKVLGINGEERLKKEVKIISFDAFHVRIWV